MATDNPFQINSFCTLPQDIHFKILCELDPESLLRCKQVCRTMADLIQAPALQYKIKLSQAGMVDGTGSPMDHPLAQRIRNLEEYMRRRQTPLENYAPATPPPWKSNGSPVRKLSVTGGILPYIQDGHFVLWQPGSALRGVEEITIVLSSTVLKANTIKPHLISGCVVDASQDLLAVTTEATDVGDRSQCHLLSLTRTGTAHSLALVPILHSAVAFIASLRPAPVEFSADLEVCGDILLWQTTTPESIIQAWNWKTGQLIWGYHRQPNDLLQLPVHACLMGYQNSLILVQDDSICVVRMDPNVVNAEPVYLRSSVAEINAEACLRLMFYPLPRWPPSWTYGVKYHAHMQRPSSPLGRQPLFEMDPALTVLAIRRPPSASASRTTRSGVSQVLIVPVSTISSFMPAPFAHVAPSSSSPKHIPVVIPFDDWATHDGAVTVTTPGRNLCFAAIGSQCVLVNHVLEKSYEGLSMLLVDVHAGARYNSHKEFHLPPVKHDSCPAGATLTASYSINLGYTTALPYKRIFVEMPMFSGYDSVVSVDLFPDQCVFQFEDMYSQETWGFYV